MIKKLLYTTLCLLTLHGCKIENDIPYPIVEGNITAFEVEGQRAAEEGGNAQATISTQNRTVTLYVDDSVDLSNLRITRLTVSNEAELIPDSAACHDYADFPRAGFETLDNLPASTDTRIDFTQPVHFTLRTYQDYDWTVTVSQIIKRNIQMDSQIGDAIIDVNSRSVIVNVASDQPLDAIKVTAFDLGGEHGTVVPDPTASDTFDFSEPVTFYVSYGWEEASYPWTVYVYHQASSGATGDVFARVTTASLSGSIQNGKTPVVEYKTQNESTWTELSSSAVTVSGTSYSAEFSGLSAGTTYQYRVNIDGVAGTEQSFTTAPATPLENGGFENWNQNNGRWDPWGSSAQSFWGTGNRGSYIASQNITTPTDDAVLGRAAKLETKHILIKLAAGNIFAGDFELDGLNGLLHFGRSFTSFPTALRLYYKYTSEIVNEVNSDAPSYMETFRNKPDTCYIYIALSDKTEPYEIRNDPNNRHLFDKNDANIIAYGEYQTGETVSSYQQITIPIKYRATNRTPRYIIIVCAASKYGDYYVGGVGSTLWLDEMELVYE